MRGIPEGGDAKRGIPMSDMTPPPLAEGVTMPDNPYTRMLESITAGRGTVSLPPPMPITQVDKATFCAVCEVPLANTGSVDGRHCPQHTGAIPDIVEEAIEPNVANLTHRQPPPPVSQPTHPLHGFDGVDLRTSEVWGDNGETFAMTQAEIEEAGQLCLRVAKRVMAGRLAELESRFAGKPKRGPRKK